MVEWYYRHLRGKDLPYHELRQFGSPPYWGHYVFHDNNRDGMQLSLPLTRAVNETFWDFRPQVVHVVRMARKAVESSVINDVAAFFLIYMVCMAAGVMLVTAIDGVSVPKAFGAMLTSLSNMGPAPFHNVGLDGYIENPSDNFAGYSPVAKYVFSLAMILGRLEFFTLLALLLPDFWRR